MKLNEIESRLEQIEVSYNVSFTTEALCLIGYILLKCARKYLGEDA